MTDQIFIPGPDGRWLAFTPDQIREALLRANEMVRALDIEPRPTSTPSPAEEIATWLSVDELV